MTFAGLLYGQNPRSRTVSASPGGRNPLAYCVRPDTDHVRRTQSRPDAIRDDTGSRCARVPVPIPSMYFLPDQYPHRHPEAATLIRLVPRPSPSFTSLIVQWESLGTSIALIASYTGKEADTVGRGHGHGRGRGHGHGRGRGHGHGRGRGHGRGHGHEPKFIF